MLSKTIAAILALHDFRPSPIVNKLFSDLVSFAISSKERYNIAPDVLEKLQYACMHAEYELEKYWAEKIVKGEKQLQDFPYYENYKQLTRLEYKALQGCLCEHAHVHSVVFV